MLKRAAGAGVRDDAGNLLSGSSRIRLGSDKCYDFILADSVKFTWCQHCFPMVVHCDAIIASFFVESNYRHFYPRSHGGGESRAEDLVTADCSKYRFYIGNKFCILKR